MCMNVKFSTDFLHTAMQHGILKQTHVHLGLDAMEIYLKMLIGDLSTPHTKGMFFIEAQEKRAPCTFRLIV
jgi:hypothetical protein